MLRLGRFTLVYERKSGPRPVRGARRPRPYETSISVSAFRMIRFSPWAASVDITARPSETDVTSPVTTISCSGKHMPRNCTDSRFTRRGSPPAAACAARATCAIPYSPCRMFDGSPTACANSRSMWIGLKSPDAPAYRCGTYLSGVTRSSSILSPSFTRSPPHDVGPRPARPLGTVLVARDRLEHKELLAVALGQVLPLDVGRDGVPRAHRLGPDELLRAVQHPREVHADVGVEDRRP